MIAAKEKPNPWRLVNWIFGVLFIIIGILNIWLVHIVPGLFYMVLSLLFLPPTTDFLRLRFGIRLPIAFTMILAVLVLWATLGVGDLMELFEGWMLRGENPFE